MTGTPQPGRSAGHRAPDEDTLGDAPHAPGGEHGHDAGHGAPDDGTPAGPGGARQDNGGARDDNGGDDDGGVPPDTRTPHRPGRGPGRALVVTASNRAAAGVYPDQGGPLIAARLAAIGFTVEGPRVVPDGDPVEQALRDGVRAGYDVIVTTGGTGISPTDGTPEATRRVVDYEVPGIAEAVRAFGREKVATASLSRGLAGVADRTLVVNLPGSTGGVQDGLAVLENLLPHAVEQLRGGDHPGTSSHARVGVPPRPQGGGSVPPGGAH